MNLKVNEPSMEDILASIRRIISDDHEPAHEAFQELEPSPLRTVLDIAERHVSSSFHPELRTEAADERSFSQEESFQDEGSITRLVESYEAKEPARPLAAAKVQASQAYAQPCERNPGEAMMSHKTEDVVSEAFSRLNSIRAASQSPTVEELMKEMLRPMLKAWLDENLPSLVERLVQAEIERVTRG
nr:DUF2497 domain-containing protein [Microvirga sp. ACRRW]